jgi:hypothetical protein
MSICILFPIICNLLLALLTFLFPIATDKRQTYRRLSILTVSEIGGFLILYCIARFLQGADSKPFATLPILITTLLVSVGFSFSERKETNKWRAFLRRCAGIAGCTFFLEVCLFHITCFSTSHETQSLHLQSIQSSDAAVVAADGITITEDCTLTFPDSYEAMRCLQLEMAGEDTYYHVTLSIKDDNLSNNFESVAKIQGTNAYDKLQFSMLPYQTLHALQLKFEDVNAPILLKSGTLSTTIPFVFSTARFFIVLIIAIALTACKRFALWQIRYRANSWKHNLAVLVTLLGCLACIPAFLTPEQHLTTLEETDVNNVYAMTLDAWVKGQVNIDLEVTPELQALETPYDASSRDGVYYHWDYAYYNGKYYCYFGCAPVALLYYPFYLLTGKVLPLNIAYCILTAAVIIMMFGFVLTLVRRYCKRPPLIALLLGLASAAIGCGVFLGLNYCDRYYLCVLSGMMGLLLSLWTGFAAVSMKRRWKRFVLLAISGIGLVITAASRPNMLLYALLLVPIFLQLLFRKDLKLWERLTSAGCFLVPLAIGMSVVMWYNNARFDSPFQFGAVYQMTVDNASANTISLSRLPAALGTYFGKLLDTMNDFPFLQVGYSALPNRMMYTYMEGSFGMFALPSILLGCLAIPVLFRYWKRKHNALIRRSTILLAMVLCTVVAWIDFCMAGISPRYLLDSLVILSPLTTILLLQVPAVLRRYHKTLAIVSQKIVALAMIGTIFVYACIVINSGDGVSLYQAHPALWNQLKEIFVFWR